MDVPFAVARVAFDALRRDTWPTEFGRADLTEIEQAWPAWVRGRDAATRARLDDGEADSVVHLLLFGSSFTARPRPTPRIVAALATNPAQAVAALGGRLDDFIAAVRTPRGNTRMDLVRAVLARANVGVEDPVSLRHYLERRLATIGQSGADRLATLATPGTGAVFAARGLSTDTTLAVDYGVERALGQITGTGLVATNSVRRIAIVGPGLDFVDKQSGYDFYPEQTIQPFALLDSLRRTGLAHEAGVRVLTFDLSARVNAHLERARERARTGTPYRVVLPRSLERPVPGDFVTFWTRFGDRVGAPATPPAVPPGAGRVAVRAVDVAADVVLAVEPRDLNVVLQRPANEPAVDLVIATNVLLYYGVFEQALALNNIASLLRPGGLLLTNTQLVEIPGVPMTLAGSTDVVYASLPGLGDVGDRLFWYRRTP